LQAAKCWDHERQRPFALHLAEHPGETELLKSGSGRLADFFRASGILPDDFQPPGLSPVTYAERLGLLDAETLAVHCVHLDERDIGILARRRVNVCLCPRSNAFIDVGRAPAGKLLRAGINLCLGTDSLTSNSDLNLWKELEFFLARNPCSPMETLRMITVNPARALKIDHDYGTLESGKKACWSIVPKSLDPLFRQK
jgi:cytosine/adenosine deaminase-related metal-dependent hydrolase